MSLGDLLVTFGVYFRALILRLLAVVFFVEVLEGIEVPS